MDVNQITEYRLMYQIPTDPERWRCATTATSWESADRYRQRIQSAPISTEKDWVFRIESRTVTTSDWEVVE